MSAATQLQDIVLQKSLTTEQIKFYKEEGYLVIPGLLAREIAAQIKINVTDIMQQIGLPQTALRQTHEYLAGTPLDALVNSPSLLALAAALMEGPSTLYMPFTAVKSGGGGGRFHFHQDNQYTRFDGPGINLWCALSEMTPENGCLQIVPRSHRKGETYESDAVEGGHKKIKWEPSDFAQIRMQPGDCVAFSRLTIHGSGENLSGEARVAYAVQYHRNDVRAVWDNQPPRLLKEHPRWNTKAVTTISVPKEKLDGH